MTLTDAAIQQILAPYRQEIVGEQFYKINEYIDLLDKWNRKISLTRVAEPTEIVQFHFGESIYALNFADFRSGRLADVGSGAGFPGLAIKILRPDLEIVLIEPNLKKSAYLAEVVRSLHLSAVEIVSKRFEESDFPSGSLQNVTCRALANSPKLLSWSHASLHPGGFLALWVSDDSADGIRRSKLFQWDRPHLIPGTKHRTILIGHKLA